MGHSLLRQSKIPLTYNINIPNLYVGCDLFSGYSGCADGSTEDFQDKRHPKIAACEGAWMGHIENATSLCAKGWHVCAWSDDVLLKTITWKDATGISGCYAINAAQDGGQCKACIGSLEQVSNNR